MLITWVLLCVIGRLLPHVPNVTPLIGLCLFVSTQLTRRLAICCMLGALVLSDVGLAYMQHHAIFSSWSWFTYSGCLIVVLLGSYLPLGKSKLITTLACVLSASFVYWLWTNFGVWCEGVLYPSSLGGLAAAYYAALPFLRNELIGDLLWYGVVFYGFFLLEKPLSLCESGETGRRAGFRFQWGNL